MTPPNFPQNNWNIYQPIVNQKKNPIYLLVFILGVVSGVLAVHFIIDSHKIALCDKDNSIFECFVAKGEIAVKFKKDVTVDPVCTNLQKNYLGCLPDLVKASLFPEETLERKRKEKAAKEKSKKPPSRVIFRDETQGDCVGDNCHPPDEPTPF